MCFLPHLNSLGFIHLRSLIQVTVTPKAQGRDSVVVSLEPAAFAVPQLVTVGGNHGPVICSAVLARQKSCGF